MIEFKRLLIKLHALIDRGLCDSDEAEMIRDDMDLHYPKLTKKEKKKLNDLSIKFNKLRDKHI